ncbi:GerAB/ArcD/ProY family transporter [Halalkalibacterium halodurans]|uniref:Spore germination protein KB n=1 Tax=Halalkalibacterium halodurans TaxID=86665 RepID=A0A0M0KN35_ALKHA|nr:endospore germination permease [Halalkalibacterium halodurans]TES57930.1 spore gernimation protein [Halalkalibacterium halodurans]TPE70755.1 spore gernimation protein [Halalkalibacterium halodurans]
MKSQQRIHAHQMSSLFFLLLIGAAIINIPGPLIGYAGNGAWLSILLSAVTGFIFVACLLYLYRKFPHLSFVEYSNKLVGKPLTILFMLPFITLNLYHLSGNALDISLFMTATMMRETPLYVFVLLTLSIVALTARLGITVFARTSTVLNLTVFGVVLLVLALASEQYQWEHFFPVMPDGIKPVLLGASFSYSFPYADIVLFSMLLPFVDKREYGKLKKGMYLSLLLGTFLLGGITLSTILVFGPIAGERIYSLFEIARTIHLYEIITGVEILIGYSLIAGAFLLDVIILYILSLVIGQLFGIKDEQIIVFPLALIGFLFSMVIISEGVAKWNEFVLVTDILLVTIVNLPLFILTAVAAWRRQIE